MKEQYIKRVKKELHMPTNVKKEILRDLEEIFSSAAEHGEAAQQVIKRLGTPREFADNAAEQFGIDHVALRKRKELISGIAALIVAVICLMGYTVAKISRIPNGVIGQADAMTNIQIEGTFSFDALHIILVIGIIAFVFSAAQMIRALRNNGR